MTLFSSCDIEFTFQKKAKSFSDLSKYVGLRAAKKLWIKNLKETKQAQNALPGWVLITGLDEFKFTFWFEYEYKEYMVIIREYDYHEDTKRFSGVCEIYEEEEEE